MVRRQSPGRAPATSATTVPAPIGGLNDRDSIANMPATDAVILDNWWVEPSQISVRKGSALHVSGIPGTPETLIEYSPPSGTTQLFAASAGDIYNVTLSGAVGAPVVSGKTNSRWQSVAITTAGGSFLYLFNGADEPQLYDGTTWKDINGTSTPAITGITDTRTIIDGVLFKNRIYLIEKNSMNFWFLPVNSIGGEAKSIPMGQIFRRGGHIVTAKTWTIDAGNGSDDHMVILSSNGEVAVFAGYNPEDVSGWSLIGVFYLGRPIGQRCAIKFGGDLLILCEDGVYPLGKGLLSSTIDRRVALTDKIQNSINQEASIYRGSFGWELCLSPDHSALILNVPALNAPYQYLQNTITGAWTKFSGWAAKTWLDSELGLFFCSPGKIMRAWITDADEGQSIVADCLQAFGYFGTKAQNKYFTMIRPYIATSGDPSILISLNGDFSQQAPSGAFATRPPAGMVWGSMVWGSMVWGGSQQEVADWQTVGGIYKSAGIRMRVQNNQAAVQWSATDFIYSRGGLL